MAINTAYYSRCHFQSLLALFQERYDEGKYTEKVPYDIWRKLRRTNVDIQVEWDSTTITFYEVYNDNLSLEGELYPVYSDKVYNDSLGRFFYNIFNNREEVPFEMTIGQYAEYNTTPYDTLAVKADNMENVLYRYADVNTTWYDGTVTKDEFDTLKTAVNELQTKNNDVNKEKNTMMKGFNFDFGPCTNDQVRMSMYGLAVKNAAGTYVSYNSKTKEIVDVDILNFDGAKYMYKFPVALSQVAVGDVVIHNKKPMFVIDADLPGKNLTVVDVCAGEQKTVIPTVNMFGFNFITKIVSLFDMTGGMATASEAQPFGNMLPLMLMGDNKDIDPMMLMMLMGGGDMSAMTENPMMLYLMMKDGKGKDTDLPMLMMLTHMSQMTHEAKCKCGKHKEGATE